MLNMKPTDTTGITYAASEIPEAGITVAQRIH